MEKCFLLPDDLSDSWNIYFAASLFSFPRSVKL